MDDRKPPESNVVRLRRDGEPDEEERQRLARTIFASEDDVGTFSRGNLLLPPPNPPSHEEPPAKPDPFFEQLQGSDHSATPGSALGDRTDTVEYFEKLASQTAAEMSADAAAAWPATVSMPGSARLPGGLDKRRRRGPRRNRAAASDRPGGKQTASRGSSRLAVASVAAVLVVSGAALAAIVAGSGHNGATRRPGTTHGSDPASALAASWPSITGPNIERLRTSRRNAAAQHRSMRQHHRHVGARRTHKPATKGTTTPRASSSAATSTVPVSATQPVQSTPVPQQPASTASSSTSGGAGSSGSGSGHQPVWGANGILGPGHSPNG